MLNVLMPDCGFVQLYFGLACFCEIDGCELIWFIFIGVELDVWLGEDCNAML